MSILERLFAIERRGTTVGRELRGAVATFLTMAYILAVNPAILSAAGVPREAAVAGTAAAAGLCCIFMGLFANFPLALASGMGLNAVVVFQVAPAAGSWQAAMGFIVLDGLVVLALVLCGLREAVLRAIPRDLRLAIGAGIGLFIAFIGAVNARIVVVPKSTLDTLAKRPDATLSPVSFGSLLEKDTLVACIGLLLMAVLLARRVRGAVVLGILASTALAFALGIASWPSEIGWPSFGTFGQADVWAALRHPQLLSLLLTFVLVDFFDTLGTVTAIAEQAKLQDAKGNILGLRRILLVDSISASVGGAFGVSSVTSYIESAAGVAEGARTGLHSVFVGLFFLLAIVLAPFASMVPAAATAPALILVGFLMTSHLSQIDFANLETGIPAFLTLVTVPFTYSITHGLGVGFISFVVIKVCALKFREVHFLMYIVAVLFAAYFVWH